MLGLTESQANRLMIHGGMRYVLGGPKNGGSKEIKARVDALVAINPTLAGSLPAHQRPSTTSTYRVRRKGSRLRIPARLPIAACRYSADQQQYRGGAQRTVTVDDRYFAAQAVMVREQIKRAGVRLGAILNTALTPGYWCPASPASSEAVASDTDRNDFWEIAGRRPSGPYPCP